MKLKGVDKDVCHQLSQNPFFLILTESATVLSDCEDKNTIIISLNSLPLDKEESSENSSSSEPESSGSETKTCFDSDECENGYCSGGKCISCGNNIYSESYDKCILKCEGKTSCEGTWDVWCCNTDKNCGKNFAECIDKCTQNADCGNSKEDYCDADGHCGTCDENMSYDSTYEKCFQICTASQNNCDDGTDRWCCPSDLTCGRADGNKCICETTDDCGEDFNGYCDTTTGNCQECDDNQYLEGKECVNKCLSNEDCPFGDCNLLTGQCVSSCSSTQYRDINGNCQNCDATTDYEPLSEYECLKCNKNANYIRYYIKNDDDEGGSCQRSSCERLKFETPNGCSFCGKLNVYTPKSAHECFFCDAFLAGLAGENNRKCQPCASNSAFSAEEANCLMCNNTDFPREMKNGKCVPVCSSTQTSCNNENKTNYWCCPKGTECGSDESEDSKCRPTSTEGRCRYKLIGSTENDVTVYRVEMDTEEYNDCPSGQYCFGKWNSSGQYQTGWIEDKTDKYLYGVCISMNHTIDSPAKDTLNPWKVSN